MVWKPSNIIPSKPSSDWLTGTWQLGTIFSKTFATLKEKPHEIHPMVVDSTYQCLNVIIDASGVPPATNGDVDNDNIVWITSAEEYSMSTECLLLETPISSATRWSIGFVGKYSTWFQHECHCSICMYKNCYQPSSVASIVLDQMKVAISWLINI